jgi:cytochrome P450 family 135
MPSARSTRGWRCASAAAGHETTATSIGWTFERLLRTPSALERLTTEVQVRESTDYIDAVIKETLRVRPVVTEVFR